VGESYFRVLTGASDSVVEVWGPLDEAAAVNLLELAAVASQNGHSVRIDLGAVPSMTPEAAALLFPRRPRWRTLLERLSHRGTIDVSVPQHPQ
jgi:hypothetical protein